MSLTLSGCSGDDVSGHLLQDTFTDTNGTATSGGGSTTVLTPIGGGGGQANNGNQGNGTTPGNRGSSGFINAVENELALVAHNPATLPVGVLLLLLAVPTGIIIYRRRRKGTAR